MWRILPTAKTVCFVVSLLLLVVGTAHAQTTPTTGSIRVLDFNTEGNISRDSGQDRDETCPAPYLQYAMNKSQFLARYMREKQIDIGAFQEVNARCPEVPLKKDVFNRSAPDLPAEQLAAITAFKSQFKAGYEKTTGKRFATDAQFEAELSRVLGKKTFEDVWVRFLPFDESFWTAMQLVYVEGYPMQAVAKPYDKNTQWFRTVTYSRFPLARALTTADYIPINYQGQDLNSDTRWFSRAPLNTPFGPINFYNVHTRAGDEACEGTKTAFTTARATNTTDSKPYMLAGDFNQNLKAGDCDSSIRNAYNLVDPGTTPTIDYLALEKNVSPLKFDLGSRQVLVAKGTPQEGAPSSEHNGFSYVINGPKTSAPAPLTSVTLPDYYPHGGTEDSNSTNPPTTVRPPTNAAPSVPICSTAQTNAAPQQGGTCFAGFVGDLNAIKSKPNVEGMLLFSPLGDNPDPNFAKHLIPPSMITQLCGGSSCAGTKIGINPGTMFGQAGKQHPATYGFDWFLQIAERGKPQDTIATINALPANTKAIIRIGIAGNGGGFTDDPQLYISFLKEVYNGLSPEKRATTYAIAGPNEPDIEWNWFAPSCNQGLNDAFYSCIGPKLSSYMNEVIAGTTGLKLLSPAFNMTSFSLNGIFNSMDAAGANWNGLAGVAGNIYPAQVPMTQHWQTNGIDALLAKAGKPLIITETGPYGCALGNSSAAPYCITPDKYYIQPINGVNGTIPTKLTAENPNGNQLDVIRDELIMQGYEARCATPGFDIKLTEDGRDAMNKLFEQPGINGVVVGGGGGGVYTRTDSTAKVYSRLDVDYRDILVPLFRDLDASDPKLKRSIEDYFGHKETNDAVYTSSELKTAAINSLLSNQQRCTVAYQNLLAQDTMCKKLADPDLCAMYETAIPNTAFTVKTLLQEFEAARGGEDVIKFCSSLMGAPAGNNALLRKGMANAPLTIEKAYRLAFMVTSVRLRTPNPSKLLNLFTHPLGGWMGPPKPNHAIAVVAFKVPDLLTNKGFNDGYTVDTAYNDTAKLTRNSLLKQDQQKQVEEEALARRRLLLEKARSLASVVHHDSWAEISCLGGGTGTSGVGSPQCKDPLSKALVDIINAQAVLGKDLAAAPTASSTADDKDEGKLVDTGKVYDFGSLLDEYEDDGELSCDADFETGLTINDPGVINAPNDPSHVFTANYGAALLANLFGDCTHDGMGSGSPSFASTQDPSTVDCGEDWYLKSKFFVVQNMLAGNDDSDKLAVKHFLVYPTGYDLRTVEGVLAGSFFTKQQLADILELQENSPSETEKITDQFRLENGKVVFNGGEGGYSYTDRVNCEERSVFQPATNTWVTITECPERSFGFRLFSTMPKAANILGGTLGYWMRNIQTNLNATTQKSYDYLKTCASLEEFLTDRCGGGTSGAVPPGQSINVPPGGNGNWVGDRCLSTTTLEQIGYNGPTILPVTGKATYYGRGVFNSTLNTRLSGAAGNDFKGNTTVKNCELPGATIGEAETNAAAIGQEYVGCVAMLRMGDLWFRNAWDKGDPDPNAVRKVWLKNDEGAVHGPFAVIDVAAERHAACLYDENWAVDIDYNSFNRLFGQTAGPDRATVCDSKNC